MKRLKYLSADTVDVLRSGVAENLERYRSGDFQDLMSDGDWSIELQCEADLSPLTDLDPSGTPAAEIENSIKVWRALGHLPPSLAYEEGIWVRLTHIECLEFSRRRWLKETEDDKAEGQIRLHFFAEGLNGRRDDNALSRLWWNGFIASKVAPYTSISPLETMLRSADTRMNLVERSRLASRTQLSAGILRLVHSSAWLREQEQNFRQFMIVLNKMGGGIVFEALGTADIDHFMLDCARRAGMPTI